MDVKKWMDRGVVEKVVVSIESAEVAAAPLLPAQRALGAPGRKHSRAPPVRVCPPPARAAPATRCPRCVSCRVRKAKTHT